MGVWLESATSLAFLGAIGPPSPILFRSIWDSVPFLIRSRSSRFFSLSSGPLSASNCLDEAGVELTRSGPPLSHYYTLWHYIQAFRLGRLWGTPGLPAPHQSGSRGMRGDRGEVAPTRHSAIFNMRPVTRSAIDQ